MSRSILSPRTKDKRLVQIPDELCEAMREVWELIQQAKQDRDIVLDYDDAIQVSNLCGGRIGTNNRPFIFTFFPSGGDAAGRWEFSIHPVEIEDIADGRMTEMLMYCCTAESCQNKFRDADQHCGKCDYVEDPNHGTFPIAKAIPLLRAMGIEGITEDSTRADVEKLFGVPYKVGDATVLGHLKIHPWAKFRFNGKKIHIAFWTNSGKIKEVTL